MVMGMVGTVTDGGVTTGAVFSPCATHTASAPAGPLHWAMTALRADSQLSASLNTTEPVAAKLLDVAISQ